MADLSFSFDPAQIEVNKSAASDAASAASDAASKATVASDGASKGTVALSKITLDSATWDKASAASSAVLVVSNAASAANSKATTASTAAATAASKASDASSATVALDATVIKSVPGQHSRAVHEIMQTSAGLIKYVYSSNAQA